MPLQKGTSQQTFGSNVSELMHSYKKKGRIGTSHPKSTEEARKQALAIAFSVKRKSR